MRMFFLIAFVLMYMVGLISTSNKVVSDSMISCSEVYTLCDYAHPADYELFAECMDEKGCGGDDDDDDEEEEEEGD